MCKNKSQTAGAKFRGQKGKRGAAVTKFIYWLKKNVGRIPITELSAAEKLYEFRSEQEGELKTK